MLETHLNVCFLSVFCAIIYFISKKATYFLEAPLNIQPMLVCFIHGSAEIDGHLPAWLLTHSSFCPRVLRLSSLTLSKAPAHNISFSVLRVIKMEATTEKITSLKHVVHTVQWLVLNLSVQCQTSLQWRITDINVTASPQQGPQAF